jgi:hypothetical protein
MQTRIVDYCCGIFSVVRFAAIDVYKKTNMKIYKVTKTTVGKDVQYSAIAILLDWFCIFYKWNEFDKAQKNVLSPNYGVHRNNVKTP